MGVGEVEHNKGDKKMSRMSRSGMRLASPKEHYRNGRDVKRGGNMSVS